MKTNHLFSALLSLALICPGIAQETHYQRPPAVIEEVALAKLSPIIRISDNNQWALQLERSPYRSIAKLAQPELKLAGMRISPETFNTSRQAEYTGASLMNIATQEEIKIEGIPDNAVITEASFSPSSNKVALFVEEANGVYLYNCTPEQPVAQKVSTRKINAARSPYRSRAFPPGSPPSASRRPDTVRRKIPGRPAPGAETPCG